MDSRYQWNLTTLAKRLRPLLLSVAEGAVSANEWDKIIHIIGDGGGATEYDPIAANLTTALAAASSGDLIWMPPCNLSGDFTIPAGVGMASMGNNTVIDGKITMAGNNSHLLGIVVTYSDSSASELVGIDCANSSGTVYINDCGITVTNSGTGDATGIKQTAAGEALIWGCNIYGNATGAGDGYAVDLGPGTIFMEGGYVHGSTNEFTAATSGSGWSSGSEISSGAIDVADSGGATITGLTPGNKYAIEAYNGPWYNGGGWTLYTFALYLSGYGWYGYIGLDGLEVMQLDYPVWCDHAEAVDANYARAYFTATSSEFGFRAADGYFPDNSGTLSYRLRSATYTAPTKNAPIVHAVRNAQDGTPVIGDRSVWDIDFDTFHASDIFNTIFLRHLPDVGTEGNIVYDDGNSWKSGTPANAGIASDIDHYTERLEDNAYADEQANQWQRRNAITSFETGGTVYQAVVYWNSDDYLNIGEREKDGTWTIYTYNGIGGLPSIQISSADNHRAANIGIDDAGYIHVVYDNRSDALKYRRSNAAINSWTGGLTSAISMLGTANEDRVTYPTFISDPAGVLYFLFLNSNVGNTAADWYFYKYTSGTTTWAAATGTGTNGKLIDGITDSYVTYIHYPVFDSDYGSGGYFHLGFHFADVGAGTDNQDISYVKWDGTNWTQSDGSAQTVPIRIGNADIFDPATSGGLTSFGSVYSDSNNNPYIAYSKESEGGYRHIHIATHTSGVWNVYQVTESESPTGGDADGLYLWNPLLVIDRNTDTGYIFYTDDRDVEGLLVQVSSDLVNWDRYVIYPRATGRIAANLDFNEFERNDLFYLVLFLWKSGESSLPVRLMKWDDTDDYKKFKLQVEEHDHSNLGAGGSVDSPTGGYWESAMVAGGASPEHFYTTDLDIAMVWIKAR